MRMELAFPLELEKAKSERWPLCIPVGVMEYHAKHCVLGCDVLIPYRLLLRYSEHRNIVVAPPVWYGPASYAIAGCEKNTIHIPSRVFEQYMYNILKSLLYGGWRNIYMIIIHQTATQNATELACIQAYKSVLYEYLEETRGAGWWGDNSNKDFYNTMEESDNPWSWFTVMPVLKRTPGQAMPLDHAGVHETSLLWACCPEGVDISRTKENTDWFAASAADASVEYGMQLIKDIFAYWDEKIRVPDKQR